jgi:hypothetical protein
VYLFNVLPKPEQHTFDAAKEWKKRFGSGSSSAPRPVAYLVTMAKSLKYIFCTVVKVSG